VGTPIFLQRLVAAYAPVNLNPDPGQLPGSKVLQDLTNGIGGWALVAALIGVVVGAIMWAFGHYSQNWQQAYNGRKGVLISGLAAVLIGGAPAIVNFLVQKGGSI
jgi:MFS family permease